LEKENLFPWRGRNGGGHRRARGICGGGGGGTAETRVGEKFEYSIDEPTVIQYLPLNQAVTAWEFKVGGGLGGSSLGCGKNLERRGDRCVRTRSFYTEGGGGNS